jgi:hypothetical protein
MYEKTEEVRKLIDIINLVYQIDFTKKNRHTVYIQARMTYTKILRDRGYTLKYIGNTIKKDHSTIIHYLKIIKFDLNNNEEFMKKFNEVNDMMLKESDPIHKLDIRELKNQIFSMRSEINELYLENKTILNKYNNIKEENYRFIPIINLIKERTPMGKEDIVLKKINALLNGINK